MNELINRIQWHILGLPIKDNMKQYYYNFLSNVRASTETKESKLRKLNTLMEAIKARYYELWVTSPLVIIGDTILTSLEDIGKGAIATGKAGLDLAKPKNLIVILIIIAVIGLITFFIIAKVKS